MSPSPNDTYDSNARVTEFGIGNAKIKNSEFLSKKKDTFSVLKIEIWGNGKTLTVKVSGIYPMAIVVFLFKHDMINNSVLIWNENMFNLRLPFRNTLFIVWSLLNILARTQ